MTDRGMTGQRMTDLGITDQWWTGRRIEAGLGDRSRRGTPLQDCPGLDGQPSGGAAAIGISRASG